MSYLHYLRLLQPVFENPFRPHLQQVCEPTDDQTGYQDPVLKLGALSHVRPETQLVPEALRVDWVGVRVNTGR